MFIFYTAIWQQYDFIIFMYVGVICSKQKLFLQYCWIKDSGVQMQGPLTLWVRIPIKSRCIRIQHYVIKFVTNKIDHHDIAEILLKVALKTIKITLIFKCRFASFIPMIFTIHVTCDSCWYPVLCTENLFLFVEFQFSWFSLFPSNHEI
jgi:hypothetical protein